MRYLLDTHIVLWLAGSPEKAVKGEKAKLAELQGQLSVMSEQMEQLKSL